MENGTKAAADWVGTGATELMWSDRNPYTVVEVLSPTRIVVKADDYKVISGSGHDGSAQYEYTARPDATPVILTLRKNGRWYPIGESIKGTSYAIGTRRRYYDPCF